MKKLILLMILATAMVMAQGHDKGKDKPNKGPGYGRGRLMEELKLTADQQKQFDQMRTDLRKSGITNRSKIQLAMVDLHQLYSADAPDRAKIEDKTREIGKLQTDVKLARAGFWFDVNKILTPDQQKVWKKVPKMAADAIQDGGWMMRLRRGLRAMRGDPDDDDEGMMDGSR